MARSHSIVVQVHGTHDLCDWLVDRLSFWGSTEVRYVVHAPALSVSVSGYSTCEEDDTDHEIADNIKRVIEANIDDYPGEGG